MIGSWCWGGSCTRRWPRSLTVRLCTDGGDGSRPLRTKRSGPNPPTSISSWHPCPLTQNTFALNLPIPHPTHLHTEQTGIDPHLTTTPTLGSYRSGSPTPHFTLTLPIPPTYIINRSGSPLSHTSSTPQDTHVHRQTGQDFPTAYPLTLRIPPIYTPTKPAPKEIYCLTVLSLKQLRLLVLASHKTYSYMYYDTLLRTCTSVNVY